MEDKQTVGRAYVAARVKVHIIAWAVLLSGFAFFGIAPDTAEAGTLVTDDMTVDTTWTLSGSPYWVDGQIKVLEGAVLTIEPGVEVKFVPRHPFAGSSLYVYGNISAIGDSTNRVSFTSNSSNPDSGDWDIIFVSGHAHLEYADISYGNWGLVFVSGNNTILESKITHVKYHGVGLTTGDLGWNEIRNSAISHNGGSGIFSNGSAPMILIENSTISHNGASGVTVISTMSGNIISRNNTVFSNQHHGLDLSGEARFEIVCNGVYANDWHGVSLYVQTSDAYIHHNNVISNVIQASDDGNASSWDDGSEGNYWSDYTGIDSDGDGIGDEPYVIDGDSQDNFPFVDPINNCPLPTENVPPVAVAKPDYQLAEENSVVWLYGNESYDWDGTIINYNWDFGDGLQGNGENVSHIYTTPGTYTVTLTVTDDKNATREDTCIIEVQDTDNVPPVAVALPKDQTVFKGDPADFYSYQSYDTDGQIVEHKWYFGDGTIGYGENVSHSYATVGSYTVVLYVKDDDGAVDTDECNVTVVQGPEPPVAVAHPEFQVVHVGEEAWFYGNDSYDPDGYIVNYTWDFGDGSFGYGEMVSHVYTDPSGYNQTYACSLTVTDNESLVDTDYCWVEVLEEIYDPPDSPNLESAVLSGDNLEDVVVRWQPSADDGSGEMDVTSYAIYHSLSYDPEGVGYEFLVELPAGSTSFTCEGVGDGESSNHFYYVQANDTEGLGAWKGQAGKFVRPLDAGRRIASIPLIQDDTTLEVVLQTLNGSYNHVRYYKSSDQSDHWKSYWTFKTYRDLFDVDHTVGFWIEMTRADSLVVAGLVPEVIGVELLHGWNFVGYPSFVDLTVLEALSSIDWKLIDGYSDVPPFHLRHLDLNDVMVAGEGYWIWVDFDQMWEF